MIDSMTNLTCEHVTRDNREYNYMGRTFMAIRTSPGGVRTDWSIIEVDSNCHGYLIPEHVKTKDLSDTIIKLCRSEPQ